MAEPEELSLKDEIERLSAADPLRRFVIVMGSGERYEINADGTTVAVGRSVIFNARRQGGYELLRLSQVSEVVVPGS